MKKQTTKLRFSDADLGNPDIRKAANKAEKAVNKADEAKARLPSGTKLRTKKASAEAEGAKLRFGKKEITEEIKRPTAVKQKIIMKGAAVSASAKAHKEVAEYEDDNVGVQAVNETEGAAEAAAQTADTVRYSHKMRNYKQAAKLEAKADKANIEALYRKRMAENPQAAANPISRWRQRQAVKGVRRNQGRAGVCRDGSGFLRKRQYGSGKRRKSCKGNEGCRRDCGQLLPAAQPSPAGYRFPGPGYFPDCGIPFFLLHAVRRDGKRGHWHVFYGGG